MTARPRTVEKAAVKREIIAALRSTGDLRAAHGLQRCAEVRLSRRHGSGWPKTCRNPGCVWCGAATARRWTRGIERWIVQDGAPVSLAVLPLRHRPGDLRAAVARLRRAVRDVRDRAARRSWRWRGVAAAGMATGDGAALLLIRHAGVERAEVAAVLRRRWSAAAIGEVGAVEPSWSLSTADVSVRDGAATRAAPPPFEPMPTAF